MKNLLLTLAIFTFSLAAFSKTNFFREGGKDNYLVSYQSQNVWVLERFEVEVGKLQERVEHKVFPSQKELKKYIKRNYQQKISQKYTPNRASYVDTETTDKVWEVKHQWTQEWERKFANWVSENLTKDFYVKHNIETDCADVAFSLRWIFARINGLPAANSLAATGKLFTQDSMKEEWKNLKRSENWREDEVFMSALLYILRNAYTGTLNKDTYPIELNKETFLVGTIHLDGGHTMIISEINYDDQTKAPIMKLSSTVPAAVRELFEQVMSDGVITDKKDGGLVRMRWPIKVNGHWELMPKKSMEFYSEEQYADIFVGDEGSFTLALVKRLGIEFNPSAILEKGLESIKSALNTRVTIVEEGFNFCSQNNCEEGTFNYEEHSTPTRDGRIAKQFKELKNMSFEFSEFDPDLPEKLEEQLEKRSFEVLGVTNSLKHYEILFSENMISHHPDDEVGMRWGVDVNSIVEVLQTRKNRLWIKREKLLAKASECREQGCRRESNAWKEANTYDFDQKLKEKVLFPLVKMKELFPNSSAVESLSSSLFNLAFLVSDPEAELNQRRGEIDAEVFNMPSGKNIYQLNNDLFYIDGNIWSLSKRVYVAKYESAIYDPENRIVIGMGTDSVETLHSETGERSYHNNVSNNGNLFWVTRSTLAQTDCPLSSDMEKRHYPSGVSRPPQSTTRGDVIVAIPSLQMCEVNLFSFDGVSFKKESTYTNSGTVYAANLNVTPSEMQAIYGYDGDMISFLLADFGSGIEKFNISAESIYGVVAGKFFINTGLRKMLLGPEGLCYLDLPENSGWDYLLAETNLYSADNGSGGKAIFSIKGDCSVKKDVSFSNYPEYLKTKDYLFITDGNKTLYFDKDLKKTELKLDSNESFVGIYRNRYLVKEYSFSSSIVTRLFLKDMEGNVLEELDSLKIPLECDGSNETCSNVGTDFLYNEKFEDDIYTKYGDYLYNGKKIASSYSIVDFSTGYDSSNYVESKNIELKTGALLLIKDYGWVFVR